MWTGAADLQMAANILYNAKCSRPSVCNAAECLLVHQDVRRNFLPRAKARLDQSAVEWRGCPRTQAILPGIAPATVEDYATEYNDYILSCKVVDSIDQAIQHIRRYSTGHSECIVTQDEQAARQFAAQVDAAAVLYQRFHPVHRWQRVWHGGRDRHLHPEAARPGPHGPAGADILEICGPWQRPGALTPSTLFVQKGLERLRCVPVLFRLHRLFQTGASAWERSSKKSRAGLVMYLSVV